MTLCNLSTHADCKATLVSLHGLPPLIEMLEGESDLVKRYSAMTLCNLSTLAANQVHSVIRISCIHRSRNYTLIARKSDSKHFYFRIIFLLCGAAFARRSALATIR